jgi:hypothetical protein
VLKNKKPERSAPGFLLQQKLFFATELAKNTANIFLALKIQSTVKKEHLRSQDIGTGNLTSTGIIYL